MKSGISGVGVCAGIIAWFGMNIYIISEVECVRRYYACTGSDLMLSSIMGVGMLIPAYFFASFVSDSRSHKK